MTLRVQTEQGYLVVGHEFGCTSEGAGSFFGRDEDQFSRCELTRGRKPATKREKKHVNRKTLFEVMQGYGVQKSGLRADIRREYDNV